MKNHFLVAVTAAVLSASMPALGQEFRAPLFKVGALICKGHECGRVAFIDSEMGSSNNQFHYCILLEKGFNSLTIKETELTESSSFPEFDDCASHLLSVGMQYNDIRGWWQQNNPQFLEGMEAVGIVPPASREGRR